MVGRGTAVAIDFLFSGLFPMLCMIDIIILVQYCDTAI